MWTELSDPAILARLGNRIKEYRIQLGLKQSEVARYSCVGINTIYKIEKGQPVSYNPCCQRPAYPRAAWESGSACARDRYYTFATFEDPRKESQADKEQKEGI